MQTRIRCRKTGCSAKDLDNNQEKINQNQRRLAAAACYPDAQRRSVRPDYSKPRLKLGDLQTPEPDGFQWKLFDEKEQREKRILTIS